MAKIDIAESLIGPTVEFYQTHIQRIDNKINELKKQRQEVEELINQLLSNETASTPADDEDPGGTIFTYALEFSPKWTIKEKIEYVLKYIKDRLTTGEIVDELLILQPSLSDDRTKTQKNVSTILSIYTGEEPDKPFAREKENKEFRYWLKNK